LNRSHSNFDPHLLVPEERATPADDLALLAHQPFLHQSPMHPFDRFTTNLTREQGVWENALSPEQTAYALAGVNAARVLPPLLDLESGYALLEYHVPLRQHLDSSLLAELASVLNDGGQALEWGRVDTHIYAAVIGAGMAACIDTTPGHESLYFRCNQALVSQFHSAHHAAELPRSLLFLQTALHERFDLLLDQIRTRVWYWLIG